MTMQELRARTQLDARQVGAMLEPRAEAREARERALERPRAIAAHAGARGHDQVLAHGQIGEDAASLGYVGDTGPRHAFGFRAGHVASLDANLAAARGDMAEERAQQRGLAHAVSTEQADALTGCDVEVDSAQYVTRPIIGVQTPGLDQRWHSTRSLD